MKLRLVVAAGLVGAMSFASMSNAAPKPVCNLVVDDKGDQEAPASETLDLVSGDIASDAKTITGVIRVSKYAPTDPSSPLGVGYQVAFTGQGGDHYVFLTLISVPNGDFFVWGHDAGTSDSNDGTATGVVDEAKGEIRISVPVADLAEHGKFTPGAKITGITAQTFMWLGFYTGIDPLYGAAYGPGDAAESAKTYVAGTKSCVAVGK